MRFYSFLCDISVSLSSWDSLNWCLYRLGMILVHTYDLVSYLRIILIMANVRILGIFVGMTATLGK